MEKYNHACHMLAITDTTRKKETPWIAYVYKPVVLNLGSIEPQGFGESVSKVRRQKILSKKDKKKFTSHILFLQLRRVRWIHTWNLFGSVPPTRLRTTDISDYKIVVYYGENLLHKRCRTIPCNLHMCVDKASELSSSKYRTQSSFLIHRNCKF